MRLHYNNRDTNDIDENSAGYHWSRDTLIHPIIYLCSMNELNVNLYSKKIVRIYDVFSEDPSRYDVPLKALATVNNTTLGLSRSKRKQFSDSEDGDSDNDNNKNKDTIIGQKRTIKEVTNKKNEGRVAKKRKR